RPAARAAGRTRGRSPRTPGHRGRARRALPGPARPREGAGQGRQVAGEAAGPAAGGRGQGSRRAPRRGSRGRRAREGGRRHARQAAAADRGGQDRADQGRRPRMAGVGHSCRRLRRANARRQQERRGDDRRAGGHHRHGGRRRHRGVLRMDDRLRPDPDHRPRQRLHEPVRLQRRPAQGRRRAGQARRPGRQRRQLRRPGAPGAVLRAAPRRQPGQSGQLAAEALAAEAAVDVSAARRRIIGWRACRRAGAPPAKHHPESCMPRSLPILAIALLLSGPASAQALPAQAREQAPPDAASARVDDAEAAENAASDVPLEEIKRFVSVYNAIREAYVEPVDDKDLMGAAIRGLLFDLDPHSAYLQKDDAQAFDEGTSGAYNGIGVEVLQLPDGKVKVIAPIDDTPAARAGVKAGDTIIAVDGKPLTPASAAGDGPLRGEPGSTVRLTIAREGEPEPLQISVTRDTIRITSVHGRMLEPGYAYVRISAFQADTAADLEKILGQLQAGEGGKLRGLVLDLRSNPGGLLTTAVQVAEDLLDEGDIV